MQEEIRRGMENIFQWAVKVSAGCSFPPGRQSLGHAEKGVRTVKRIVQRLGPWDGLDFLARFGLGVGDPHPGEAPEVRVCDQPSDFA